MLIGWPSAQVLLHDHRARPGDQQDATAGNLIQATVLGPGATFTTIGRQCPA